MQSQPVRRSGAFHAGKGEAQLLALLGNRVDGLFASCERLRVEKREAQPWSSLLGDFGALGMSLRMLRESLPAAFNSLAVAPAETPLDMNAARTVPDLLLTQPSDGEYERAAALLAEHYDEGQKAAGEPRELAERRKRIQKFNAQLDKALEVFQETTAESSTVRVPRQESAAKTPHQIQQEYNRMALMLNMLHEGTTLEISAP